MEINDYNSRLSDARKNYRDAANDLKASSKREKEGLVEAHEERENVQKKVFLEQKNNLEEQNSKNVDKFNKQVAEEIQIRTDRFKKGSEKELKSFNKDRKNMQSDYNRKLFEVSDSFKVAKKEQAKLDKVFKESMKERFNNNYTRAQKGFDDKLSFVTTDSSEKFDKFRDDQNLEKRNLLYKHRAEKQGLVQDANIAKNKLKNTFQAEKQNLRSAYASQEKQLTNNHENSYHNMLGNKNSELSNMKGNFEDLTRTLSQRGQDEVQKQAKANKSEKRQLENKFGSDRIQWERKTNDLINSGHGDKAQLDKQRITESFENRHRNVMKAMETQNNTNQQLTSRVAQDFQDELKKNDILHKSEVGGKNVEIARIQKEVVGGLKEKQEKIMESYSSRLKNMEMAREEDNVDAKQNLQNSVDRTKLQLTREINAIQEGNSQVLSDMKHELAKEQTKFIGDVHRQTFAEREDLKADLKTSFGKKESSLNQQIKQGIDDKIRVKEQLEKKLENHKKVANNEINTLKRMNHDQKLSDKREFKVMMENKDTENAKNLGNARAEFDRKLQKHKNYSDVHVAKLTQRYEAQIARERREAGAELKLKVGMSNNQYSRLLKKTNTERESLIAQYEMKMEQLRNAHMHQREINNARKKTSEAEEA